MAMAATQDSTFDWRELGAQVKILTTGIPTQIVLTSDFGDGFLKLGTGLAAFHGTQVSTLEKPFRRTALSKFLKTIADS
jgi:hypothetical protein